jgi:DUF218 domain
MEKIVLASIGVDEARFWVGPCVEHANFLFKVLVGGRTTRYPDVDSYIYKENDADYDDFLSQICMEWLASCEATLCPLYDWFLLATLIHMANDGGTLARNVELQEAGNVTVFRAARHIDWKAKPFTMVLILGQSHDQKLSPLCKGKIRKAVAENTGYRLAPLYMGYGGTDRPRSTDISESDQMKKCATEEFGIPEERFAIEATSEHTYSNFLHAAILGAAIGTDHA